MDGGKPIMESLPDPRQSAIRKAGAESLQLSHHRAADVGLTRDFTDQRTDFLGAEQAIARYSL